MKRYLLALKVRVWGTCLVCAVGAVGAQAGPPGGPFADLQDQIAALPEIKFITTVPFNPLIAGFFQMRFTCSENFQVSGVYAQAQDPDQTPHDIKYVNIFSNGGLLPLVGTIGQLGFVVFDPAAGMASIQGYELLSQLQVGGPVGVPAGSTLTIVGQVEAGASGNERLVASAVVLTAQDAVCNGVIVP